MFFLFLNRKEAVGDERSGSGYKLDFDLLAIDIKTSIENYRKYVGRRQGRLVDVQKLSLTSGFFFLVYVSLSLYFSLFLSTFNNNSPTLGFSSSLFEKFPDKEPKQTTCVVEGVCASSSSLLFLLLLQRTFHHLFFPFPCVFRVLYFLSLPFFFLGWLFGRESRVPDTKRAKRIELHCDICFVLFGSLVQFSRKTEAFWLLLLLPHLHLLLLLFFQWVLSDSLNPIDDHPNHSLFWLDSFAPSQPRLHEYQNTEMTRRGLAGMRGEWTSISSAPK